MAETGQDSLSNWIDGIRNGDSVAAERLWDHYFDRLIAVARRHLGGFDRARDGEDIAASAMKSVMLGIRDNGLTRLADRGGLWPLLVTITARKAIGEIRRQSAQKRGGTVVSIHDVTSVVGSEPTPEFVATLAETLDTLVEKLGDPQLKTIAIRKLEGYTHEEIAAELNCAQRTVIRKIKRVRQEWRESETDRAAENEPRSLP